jgi:hypothetical protein
MPKKDDKPTNKTNTRMTSQQLTQKAAGYMLAAANASKLESNLKKKDGKK